MTKIFFRCCRTNAKQRARRRGQRKESGWNAGKYFCIIRSRAWVWEGTQSRRHANTGHVRSRNALVGSYFVKRHQSQFIYLRFFFLFFKNRNWSVKSKPWRRYVVFFIKSKWSFRYLWITAFFKNQFIVAHSDLVSLSSSPKWMAKKAGSYQRLSMLTIQSTLLTNFPFSSFLGCYSPSDQS